MRLLVSRLLRFLEDDGRFVREGLKRVRKKELRKMASIMTVLMKLISRKGLSMKQILTKNVSMKEASRKMISKKRVLRRIVRKEQTLMKERLFLDVFP